MTNAAERVTAALHGRYDIEREAGRGGMATVFVARDVRHDRPVAVKVMHEELAASLGSERFLREVQISARLSHPHILPLLDSGSADGQLYYVMPFVEGESLRARLDRAGALPVGEAIALAREVADALGYAHARGIVHRDIKPENILLDSGHALVADFGVARAVDEAAGARVTATGLAVGTPQYMSPEQMEGLADVDGRSDLYALGCLLFEMLAGTPPFAGPGIHAIVARRLMEPAPSVRGARHSVPPALDDVVRRLLARDRADRIQYAAEVVAALDPVTITGPGAGSATRVAKRRWIPVIAATAALLLALSWEARRRATASPTDVPPRAIAVLPFVNLSADSAQEYFADGLTDELITSLSLVQGVHVASRTSSFAFKRQELDVREIGRRLGVQSVLEGSVRRGDRRVRVAARLVNVADGYQRWSHSYDRSEDDALVIQEEIARAIVETLQGRLAAGHGEAVRSGTTDPEAYDLYLRGRFFRYRRTEESLRRAVDLLQQSVARAPDFARAYAGLAESWAVIGFYEMEPARVAFPAAARAATRALELDPALGSAHATLGYVALYHDWDWSRAEEAFRRAIDREPGYATAHQWHANYLTAMGRPREAERAMRRAIALDPLAAIGNAALIWVYFHAGDHARALAQFRATRELDSTFALAYLWGGQALEALGRPDEAVAVLREGVRLSGGSAIYNASLARGLASAGDRAGALRLLDGVTAARVIPAYDVAKVHIALGNHAEALRWLERAFEERSHSLVFLRVDPQLNALRGEAAFEALVRRVGL